MCDVLGTRISRYGLCYYVIINTMYAFSSLGVYVVDMYYTVHWFDVD
jgi:hypothetical protein